ncbi:MAG: glycosyltransferase, partial [Bacteroidaceae bacterium]|nr:glycosyltransferase [Bacteroidaceae bacterium]
MKDCPLISIITVTYNAEATLERTLHSIEAQTYPHIEHILIDGCSTDHTMSQIQRYVERNGGKSRTIRVIREPDNGLYDAMNKGIQQATGDYLVFLNAGDRLHEPTTIEHLAARSDWQRGRVNYAVLYGETDLVDDGGNFLRHRRLRAPEKLTSKSFRSGMLVCHQSFYVRTDLAKATPYDLRYRYSADYDWCIRLMQRAEKRRLRFLNTHLILTDYLSEGLTTTNHRKSLLERLRLMA